MTLFTFGNPSSETVLIQPVDEHDLQTMDREVNAIRELSGSDFCLIACKIDCWNADLSPWESPAVFGREGFGSGAPESAAYSARYRRPKMVGRGFRRYLCLSLLNRIAGVESEFSSKCF